MKIFSEIQIFLDILCSYFGKILKYGRILHLLFPLKVGKIYECPLELVANGV